MWPRGKAGVCKTLYGGSNQSVTSESLLFNGSQLLRGVFLYAPFFELKAFLSFRLKMGFRLKKGYGTSTDSAGHYSIKLATTDSVYFSWLGKTTNRFAVKEIPANEPFDLNFDEVSVRSLPAYSVVGAKDYVQDSLNNREQYKKLFGYEGKDGVQDRTNPGGTAGLSWDLDNMLSPSARQPEAGCTAAHTGK